MKTKREDVCVPEPLLFRPDSVPLDNSCMHQRYFRTFPHHILNTKRFLPSLWFHPPRIENMLKHQRRPPSASSRRGTADNLVCLFVRTFQPRTLGTWNFQWRRCSREGKKSSERKSYLCHSCLWSDDAFLSCKVRTHRLDRFLLLQRRISCIWRCLAPTFHRHHRFHIR